MSWSGLQVSPCGTHHIDEQGRPAYAARFDEVLKFHAPGLAPVRRDEQAWHVKPDGSAAYERRFARTFGYYEGGAAVVSLDSGDWHHITPDGNEAYARRHAWCGNFQQGRCTVRDKDGAYHHIAPNGDDTYAERWRYAGDYRNGIAVVQASNGLSSHVRLDGSLLHERWFVDLDVFHKGFARARDDDGWMHVDLDGSPVYERRFNAVEPFYNGQARVERIDGGLEVIDETGAALVELRAARRSEFACLSADMVGFWRTQTIGAAVELGVIEALPATHDEVGARCGLDADRTRRLLRALGELSLVERRGTRWELTTRGDFLRVDHNLTLADAAIEYAGPFSAMWGDLPDALRRGRSWTGPDVFGEVARDETRRVGHHRMLRSYARHDYVDVCGALELRGDERLIDAGGGLGVLVEQIVKTHPSVEVVVLERPEVVAMAPSIASVRWQSGSLFEPWGIEADAVVLSRVLHDWDDTEALHVLRHARAALSSGGRLYVVEMLVSDEDMAGSLCDLHLLMATGGRERSVEHYGRLLSASGFELHAVRRLPALPSVIVGAAS